MACGSVAVSKAQIAQVAIAQDQLKNMLSKILGLPLEEIGYYEANTGDTVKTHSGRKLKLAYDYSHAKYYGYQYAGVNSITITQRITESEVKIELSVSAINNTVAQALQEELEEAFKKQLTVAQQSTVLKKLAALGKLSNIVQKDNGVVARIEISI